MINNVKIIDGVYFIMTDNLRIHIIPVGYDTTRATEPLLSKKADKVYFIRHKEDEESTYYNFIISKIQDKGIEIHQEFVDIWDLFECIQKFREIISQGKGNHFYINLSTGSKITAIAGMLTSMLIQDVEPYYVHIKYAPQKTKEPIMEDVIKSSSKLPVFGINEPPKEHLVVLGLLSEHKDMKKARLIEDLENQGIIEQKDMEKQSFSEHAKHSQLRTILDPMERTWKFIEIEGKGKKSRVKITRQGGFALKMFDEAKISRNM